MLQKDTTTQPPPHEPSDTHWFHLHRAHPTLPDASSNTIAPIIINGYNELDAADSGIELRYQVHGVAVSDRLAPPFRFELNIDNPALSQLSDGVHDLSVEVRGAASVDFKPWRAFVHLSRDKNSGEPFGFNHEVPIINAMQDRSNTYPHYGPGVVYVDPAERSEQGFPVSPEATPWQQRPDQARCTRKRWHHIPNCFTQCRCGGITQRTQAHRLSVD